MMTLKTLCTLSLGHFFYDDDIIISCLLGQPSMGESLSMIIWHFIVIIHDFLGDRCYR
jgi:hypothetical protein